MIRPVQKAQVPQSRATARLSMIGSGLAAQDCLSAFVSELEEERLLFS